MSRAPLDWAKDCLHIHDIWLQSSNAWIGEEFDPKFSNIHEISAQFKHGVSRSTFSEVTDHEGENSYLFRVYLEIGLRLIPGSEPRATNSKKDSHPHVLAQIEATMVAEYSCREDPGQEALDAFASQNAGYHVWPFWREYLVSQCERMRLPKVFIPTMQLPQS